MNSILVFKPLLKERIWGRFNLPNHYGIEAVKPIGESWVLADHDDDVSVVAKGKLAGKSLRELFVSNCDDLVGNAVDQGRPDRFPLLLKILDSQKNLSVQVHPDDSYAKQKKAGELGKTEAWYILKTDPGACIYYGLKAGTSKGDLQKALNTGNFTDCLNRLEVNSGEVYFIPAGTVHAMGAGLILAEIQQNSDTTYRLFDWNRTGLDNKPRALHLEDGLATIKLEGTSDFRCLPEVKQNNTCLTERFINCEKFVFEKLSQFSAPTGFVSEKNLFHILFAAQGKFTVKTVAGDTLLNKWDSCLLPAAVDNYTISASIDTEILRFYVPKGKV